MNDATGGSMMLGSSRAGLPPPSGGKGGGLRMDAAAQAALRGSQRQGVGPSSTNSGSGSGSGSGGGLPRASSSSSLASGASGSSSTLTAATAATTATAAAAGGGGRGGAAAGASASGSGGRGFLDDVESVQQGEVMRLLTCMKTLGDENAALIKQVEASAGVRQENERLRREVAEFKDLYAARVRGFVDAGVDAYGVCMWVLRRGRADGPTLTSLACFPHDKFKKTHSSSSSAPPWKSFGNGTRTR